MTYLDDMQRQLDEMARADLLRDPVVLSGPVGPTVSLDGREVVCLCSNDYLSLACDGRVTSAACRAIEQWGLGSGASRLVSGSMQPHVQLERRLAEFKRVPAVAVTSTGWMANQVAISTLARAGDLIVCDKLNHASILDAARNTGARVRTYLHRDTARLESVLRRHRGDFNRCLIVTDAVFSMDGDLAPLAEIGRIKQKYDAILVIDEAHGTGVLGEAGRGAAELLGCEDCVDVVVGTLSKALAGLGGFVAGPEVLIRQIRNTARAYIYTTAPPPAICQALTTSLDIVESEPERRTHLLAMAELLRSRLGQMGIDTADSACQIVPVIVGSAGRALQVTASLLSAGFLVPAIRPPTVPRGSSRLRVSLAAGHRREHIESFCDALAEALASCPDRETP